MARCTRPCVKYVLIVFNGICALGSVALMVVASMIQWRLYYYHLFSSVNLSVATVMLLVTSSLLVLISVLACWAAILENRWMLNTSAGLSFLTSSTQLAGAGLALAVAFSSSDLHSSLESSMSEMGALYLSPGQEGDLARLAWDHTQKDLHCCGKSGPQDWLNLGLAAPPPSCQCDVTSPQCETGVYSTGCYGVLVWILYDLERLVAMLGFVIAGVQIVICVVLALILGCLVHRHRRKMTNVL